MSPNSNHAATINSYSFRKRIVESPPAPKDPASIEKKTPKIQEYFSCIVRQAREHGSCAVWVHGGRHSQGGGAACGQDARPAKGPGHDRTGGWGQLLFSPPFLFWSVQRSNNKRHRLGQLRRGCMSFCGHIRGGASGGRWARTRHSQDGRSGGGGGDGAAAAAPASTQLDATQTRAKRGTCTAQRCSAPAPAAAVDANNKSFSRRAGPGQRQSRRYEIP